MTPATNFTYTPEREVHRIEDLTRREFMFSAFGAALLIACGDDDEEDPASAPTSAPTTRTVDHAYGATEVPVDPQRVIVTDNEALPYVLELGVVPVAAGTLGAETYDGRDFFPSLYDLGVAEVTPFSRDEPDYELISTLEADLIVGATFSLENRVQGGVETYQTIAPLVAVDSTLPLFDQIRAYGRILGREERAEELIADFERSIRSLRTDITVETISIARAFGDADIFVYTSAEPFTSLWFDLLGITVVPGPEAGRPGVGTLIASGEQVGLLEGEALVVLFGIERLETNPLWSLLPAVQADQVYDANDYLVYTGQGGLNALRDQILGIARFLAALE